MTTFPRPHSRRLLLAAGLALFALTAFLMLHPMLFTTGTHSAGYDFFNYHWNFWWLRTASTTPGLTVYATDYTMFPYTTNLGYHALTAFWFPAYSALQAVVGGLAAMNAIVWIACTLNGWLTFVWLLRERAHPAVALLGGLALQAAPTLRYFYYNTHINLMDWFWLPALLLIWGGIVTLIDRRRTAWAVVAAIGFGAALWGVGLTDLQFPIFAAFLLAPYGLLTLWRSRRKMPLIAVGGLAVGLAAALLWFAGPLPHMRAFTGTLAPGIAEDRPGVPIPDGFLRMADQWWEWSQPSIGAWFTLAIALAVVLGLRGMIRDRRWFWFALMLPPLVFALGPTLTIGDLAVPLPFRGLHALTNGMFRMPWRLVPIAVIAGMGFAALVFTPVARRHPVGKFALVAVALLLLMADVRFYQSGPLQPLPTDYAFYHAIGAERGPGYDELVLIEAPTGAASGEVIFGDPRATQLQWYGITHGKRLVNGFISRAPLEHFFYLETGDPLLSWLGQRRFLDLALVEPLLRQRVADWPIGYIVIHRDLIGPQSAAVNEIIGTFNGLTDVLCPMWIEGAAVVYRTSAHPDGCPARTPTPDADGGFTIDIGGPDDARYLRMGWHYAEGIVGTTLRWAGDAPSAGLTVDLPPGVYTVEVTMQAFHAPRAVTLRAGETDLENTQTVSIESLAVYRFTLPASAVGGGRALPIALVYDEAIAPIDLGMGSDSRRLAVAVDSIRFIPASAS